VDAALSQFQQALAIHPGDAEAHNGLGVALAQKGRLDLAIAQFQEALRLEPDYTGAQMNLTQARAMTRSKAQHP
jgi:Flp pilus assembly protein TadD